MVEAYPLHWPSGYPRTKYPQINGRMGKASFASGRDSIIAELRRMGASNVILSTNIPLKNDGLPYATFSRTNIKDEGVAVYFTLNKQQIVLCCDKWNRIEVNMRSIALTVKAMRDLERWGVSEMMQRMFTGFKALPDAKEWWEILGVNKSASKDEIISAYRNKAKQHHPDAGGTDHQFAEISNAYQEGLKHAS